MSGEVNKREKGNIDIIVRMLYTVVLLSLDSVSMFLIRMDEWAVCFRKGETMRGINTNNYAESGIRILKDIVFSRDKA